MSAKKPNWHATLDIPFELKALTEDKEGCDRQNGEYDPLQPEWHRNVGQPE